MTDEPLEEDALPRLLALEATLHEALNRLNRYYYGRSQSALRVSREKPHGSREWGECLQSSIAWANKQEAVLKVAENVGIALKSLETSKSV